MPVLTAGGPALVHFLDFAQLNSVRTLPYVAEWDRRYRDAGLRTIGVQAPRFPFGADPRGRRRGPRAARDRASRSRSTPTAPSGTHYGCEGWPSLFLWSLGGALSWFHFGEGDYLGTEEAIQAELREQDALRELPAPLEPLRATDAPGARVMAPTPEVFPGGSWERPWTAGEDGEELVRPLRGRRRPRDRRGRRGAGRRARRRGAGAARGRRRPPSTTSPSTPGTRATRSSCGPPPACASGR